MTGSDAAAAPAPGAALAAGAAAVLVAAIVATAAGVGAGGGLLYLGIYLLATVPGLPVGFALFGRRHAAGCVAGALLGYALTSLTVWASVRLGYHTGGELAAAWLVLNGVTWPVFGLAWRGPAVTLHPWTRRDTAALLLVLLLVPALTAAPFLKVGLREPDGSRAYRAYFTMDFFWHTALTAEVSKFTSPPRNPYLASQPLHYYWTYFLVPAAVVGNAPARLAVRVEPTLLVNALCTGVLLIAMVFLAAWAAVPRAGPIAAAVAFVVLASSAEGSWALLDLFRRGRPLSLVRDLNIDAVAAWTFGGLRIDGLPRSLWWVPQHATACALGLVALIVAAAEGASAGLAAILFAGLALGAAVTMSPFLGAAFSLVFAAAVAADSLREPRRAVARLGRHALAAVPVAVALAWCVRTGMLEGTSGAMKIGWGGLAAHSPIRVLLLSLGPVLLPASVGLWAARRTPRHAITAAAGLLVGLALYYLLWIPLDEAYVGFRAGQVMLVSLPALVAIGIDAGRRPAVRRVGAVALVLCFAVGLPTTLIDWYNAQDTDNRGMGPGFRWTLRVTPDEQEAFQWIRRATDPRATVQMEPTSRERDTWTLIPTFAHRRMAAGMAYSLLRRPEFEERSLRVRTMYATLDARAAWGTARALGIDYIYVDRAERAAFPSDALAKFDGHPDFFRRVFANAEVRIYSVVSGGR